MRPSGKRGRKTIRSLKRKRYDVSFERRYKMKRSDWVEYKKTHSKQEVHIKRELARE